jgi:ABC-type xylose transport system permease subunit
MLSRKSRLDFHVEKTENLVHYLLRKKRENIQNSLVRPLHQEALKSLFLVAVLLIDTLIPLEVYRDLPLPFNIAVSLVVLGVFLYVEIRLYNSFWGKKGRWSLEKYKNVSKQSNEEKEKS